MELFDILFWIGDMKQREKARRRGRRGTQRSVVAQDARHARRRHGNIEARKQGHEGLCARDACVNCASAGDGVRVFAAAEGGSAPVDVRHGTPRAAQHEPERGQQANQEIRAGISAVGDSGRGESGEKYE